MDEQECDRCGDEVLTLSSRGWCDGCEEQIDLIAVRAIARIVRDHASQV